MEGDEHVSKGSVHVEFDHLLPYLVEQALQWLWEQRDLHMVNARPLSDHERLLLQDYYDSSILDRVRLATAERISNPTFYGELTESGYPVLDLSGSAGITFIDCVVIRRVFHQDPPAWISILFHELVHVVQFGILGPRKHVESYLRGWAQNGYQYHRIPFEMQAHKLEARFDRHEPPFSVREVVEQELRGVA